MMVLFCKSDLALKISSNSDRCDEKKEQEKPYRAPSQ